MGKGKNFHHLLQVRKEGSNLNKLGITMLKYQLPEKFNLKIVEGDGYTCVSVTGWNCYSINNKKEPEGGIYGPFKEKRYNRGKILRKLGLWENGRILPREKKLQ